MSTFFDLKQGNGHQVQKQRWWRHLKWRVEQQRKWHFSNRQRKRHAKWDRRTRRVKLLGKWDSRILVSKERVAKQKACFSKWHRDKEKVCLLTTNWLFRLLTPIFLLVILVLANQRSLKRNAAKVSRLFAPFVMLNVDFFINFISWLIKNAIPLGEWNSRWHQNNSTGRSIQSSRKSVGHKDYPRRYWLYIAGICQAGNRGASSKVLGKA